MLSWFSFRTRCHCKSIKTNIVTRLDQIGGKVNDSFWIFYFIYLKFIWSSIKKKKKTLEKRSTMCKDVLKKVKLYLTRTWHFTWNYMYTQFLGEPQRCSSLDVRLLHVYLLLSAIQLVLKSLLKVKSLFYNAGPFEMTRCYFFLIVRPWGPFKRETSGLQTGRCHLWCVLCIYWSNLHRSGTN